MREFNLDDTEWQNSEKWEWVDTRIESTVSVVRPLISEFAVHNAEGDATEQLLTQKGRLYLLCVTDPTHLSEACAERMGALIADANNEGAMVVCLTPDPLYGATTCRIANHEIVCYNIDGSTMKTMLRARNGLVVLDDGTISGKYNCVDIPTKTK